MGGVNAATDPSPVDTLIAQELEDQAAQFASRAAEYYPESVFPPPTIGKISSPDNYTAAGWRNAYRKVAGDLRDRATELRAGRCYPDAEAVPR